jgi:hypothetical protein
VDTPPPAADLELNPDAGARPGARWKRPVAGYEEIYGTKTRAIMRWISIGRAAGDLPPLDDPIGLVAWWERHMTWRVPAKIQEAAGRARGTGASGVIAPVAALAAPAPDGPPEAAAGAPEVPHVTTLIPADFTSVEAFTLVQVLENLRVNVGFLLREQRKQAESGYNRESFTAFQRDIDRTTEQIRKTESSIEAIRLKRGELIDKAQARDELQRIHSAMAMSLETELHREFAIPRERSRGFVNRWFLHLRSSELSSGTEPAALPSLAVAA